MRRKGGRTITSSTASAGAPTDAGHGSSTAPAAPPSAVAAAAAASSVAVSGKPTSPTATGTSASPPSFPAVAIPTLDIFARFQSKRDDFDANWLLLEEDAVDVDKAPPISSDVADKLRQHQQRLATSRGAAGKNKEGSGSGSTVPAPTTGKSKRSAAIKGGRDFDQVAKVTAVDSVRGEQARPRRTAPMDRASDDEDDDDDEEYMPESKDAAQYGKQKDRSSSSATATTITAAEVKQREGETTGATGVAEGKEDEEEEGIQGDFLTFLPKNLAATASNPNADAKDLQAVVALGSPRGKAPVWNSEMNKAPVSSASATATTAVRATTTASTAAASPVSSSRGEGQNANTLVVPLWSAERVRRFGGYYPGNRLVALHQEVCDLVDFLRPTPAEVAVRRYVELRVRRLVQKLWPKSRLIVFGSLYTHLLLPLSDVDMTLVDMPADVTPDEALTALAAEISRDGLCHTANPNVILKTKVPLIKFQHKGSLVDIDISVNAPDGKSNSDIVIHLLNFYPEARPLIVVVKYFLQQRDMHEPYHGGLGSYATTLLVLNFLQAHPIYTTRPQERPFTGLGKLLVDFFRYCGQYWNYHKCGISLTAGGYYFRRSDQDGPFSPSSPTSPRSPLAPPQAIIEDPLNSVNNTASSLRNFHMISSVFANAYQALTAPFPTAFELSSGDGSTSGSPGGRGGASGGGGGSATARCMADFSPDSPQIALRPTLLSRVLHVDADTVYRRQSIAATYTELLEADPAAMAEAEQYRADDDAPMLTGAHVLRLASSASPTPSSPVTKEEAKGLASLTAAAAAAAASTGQAKARSKASGKKRPRDVHSTSDSSAEEGSEGHSSNRVAGSQGGDSGSNASSVRVDVSKPSKRRKQMARHS